MVSIHSSESIFRKQLCSVELKVFSRQVHWLPTNKQRLIVWLMPDRHSKWLPSLLLLVILFKTPVPLSSSMFHSSLFVRHPSIVSEFSVSDACVNSFQTAARQLSVSALSSSLGITSKEKPAGGLFFWLHGHANRKINWTSVFLRNPIFHNIPFDTALVASIWIRPL